MKSLMLFLQYLLLDCGRWCSTSTIRDFKTITDRVEHEGLSFLTIVLPEFGKDFERSLDESRVARDRFQGFSWRAGLPEFLRGFLEQVFDSKTGVLLDKPSTDAIFAVRQITLSLAKIELPCAERRVRAAYDGYIQCEQDLSVSDEELLAQPGIEDGVSYRHYRPLELSMRQHFSVLSLRLWGDLFQAVDEDIFYGLIIPDHGPGKVANRLGNNSRWGLLEWTERLEKVFPAMEHLFAGGWSERIALDAVVKVLDPGAELPVRVVQVPKTMKAPRVIAMEPSYMMFVQQGILHSIQRHLSNHWMDDFVSLQDQGPNQVLARLGSLDGSLATLDLSEASDRVSNLHVRDLLARFPNLAEGVDACRSRKADVPGHGTLPVSKFASMGSALTFPMECFVFLTLTFMGIERASNTRLSKKGIQSFKDSVRVYGDDIICPSDCVGSVIECLTAFGFKVNSSKSFWNGKFRESCGSDWYDGVDVSIAKVRTMFPSSRRHALEIVKTVALRNHLYKRGLWRAAGYLDDVLERYIPLPYADEQSPVLGRESFIDWEQPMKLCPRLQRPLVRGVIQTSALPRDHLEGHGALLKCLTMLESRAADVLPSVDRDHLEQAGRARSVNIKTGWFPRH